MQETTRTIARNRSASVTVCVPTLDEAATIGPICRELVGLREAGVVDRVLVLDQSTDATAALAEAAGADVIEQERVLPAFGPVRGKGDALWRALHVIDTEVVVFVDGDTVDFSARMAADLVAATAGESYAFVKAAYRRPFAVGGEVRPTGGGRVTELAAKPLLAALLPELAAFRQPLAGEMAARTDLLRQLPFALDYAVDVALLIDAWRAVGIGAMAEVDTGVRQNRHRPLEQLSPMASQVTGAILDRAGVARGHAVLPERPPMNSLRPQHVNAAVPDALVEAA